MVLALVGLPSLATIAPAQWANGAEDEWYLPTGDGCELYVYERGRGADTVVVLHGGFGHDHGYMVPAFAGIENRYRLIFYDQRGSLRSPCPDSLISLQKLIDDLERLRAALGHARINIASHSMGTILAMSYLQQHPTRVNALLLIGALPARTFPDQAGTTLAQRLAPGRDSMSADRPAAREQLRKDGLDKDSAQLTPKQRSHAWRIGFSARNMYHVDRWRQMRGGRIFYNGSAGAAAGRTVPNTYDFTPAIAAHRCQVWVIIGDHDYVDFGLVNHKRWTAQVPNARLAVLHDAGHAGWLDDPVRFQQYLLEGLRCRKG
jgi:pimeloyl-ACP methyl ester carboxylesterase